MFTRTRYALVCRVFGKGGRNGREREIVVESVKRSWLDLIDCQGTTGKARRVSASNKRMTVRSTSW